MTGWKTCWHNNHLIWLLAKYRSETRNVRSVPARANSGGGGQWVSREGCPVSPVWSRLWLQHPTSCRQAQSCLGPRGDNSSPHRLCALCHRSQSEKLWIDWENCCSSLVLSCCQWNAAEIRINDLCLERARSQLSVNWAEIRQHVATARQHSQERPQVQTCYKNINNTLLVSVICEDVSVQSPPLIHWPYLASRLPPGAGPVQRPGPPRQRQDDGPRDQPPGEMPENTHIHCFAMDMKWGYLW